MKALQTLDNLGSRMIKFGLLTFLFFHQLILRAQEEGGEELDVNVDIGTDEGAAAWYSSWWIWVVGILLFVIIIIAIISAGRRRD